MQQVRDEREGERGGGAPAPPADGARLAVSRGRRARAVWRGHATPRGRLNRGGGGADRQARAHSAERLRWLTGEHGHTVLAARFNQI
jgi:hypothetical protein